MKYYLMFFVVLVLLFIYELEAGKICYLAKTCIHSAVERCGINDKGELRRFIDSCDMLEYNCLKNTVYKKTSQSRCSSLPPLEYGKENIDKDEEKSDEYIPQKEFHAGDQTSLDANENLDTPIENTENEETLGNISTEKNEHTKAATIENLEELKNNSGESYENLDENVKNLQPNVSKEDTAEVNTNDAEDVKNDDLNKCESTEIDSGTKEVEINESVDNESTINDSNKDEK